MRSIVSLVLVLAMFAASAAAQERAITAQPGNNPAAAKFQAVLEQALGALAAAGSYEVNVESQWGGANSAAQQQGGGRFRLVVDGRKYRVEVRSTSAATPDLQCVNDGAQVTTLYPARNLYSRHAADSPAASLEANKMLFLSLQGSALDILLQPQVAQHVQSQVSGLVDHGEALLGGTKTRYFEVVWGGAKVELWFAAQGQPLLVQFRRTASVAAGMTEPHALVCTAKFQWHLGQRPSENTFVLSLPSGARQVNEIYEALAGHEAGGLVGKPLPQLSLARLDGSDVELRAAADKKATVLIFWATWCAESVEDLPAVHQFVAAHKGRGIDFYAINVGEQPGAVRRFTAKHPLVSSVLLDPHGKATSALRVSELPAVAIIAPDNSIRAILHGSAKELQGELAAQLNAVAAGPPSSTARRAGESGPQSK